MDTGDRLWRVFCTNRLEDLKLSDADREKLRRLLFLEPLPFVRRLVFIATPHRGSYLSGGLARRLAQRLVSLPGAMVSRGTDLLRLADDDHVLEVGDELVLSGTGRAVAWAFTDAALSIQPAIHRLAA